MTDPNAHKLIDSLELSSNIYIRDLNCLNKGLKEAIQGSPTFFGILKDLCPRQRLHAILKPTLRLFIEDIVTLDCFLDAFQSRQMIPLLLLKFAQQTHLRSLNQPPLLSLVAAVAHS